MSNYIFLTENFNEGTKRYFAISSDKIETLNLSETYDGYGQTVGHYNAGDYHMDNSEGSAVMDCTKAISEKFEIDMDNIHIIDNDGEFEIEAGEGEEYSFDENEVNSFIKEWRKENESLTEVKGFDYWDGHNWKTVVTGCDFGEPSHEIVNDELTKELNEAIENMSFEKEGFGCKVYTYENWVIIDSNWQGTWASYELMKVEDYGYLQEAGTSLPNIF